MPPEHEMIKFFRYKHLPNQLQEISRKFFVLAKEMDTNLPHGTEKDQFFRKLLEAKDCAVRANL